jgi:hypothetical protein
MKLKQAVKITEGYYSPDQAIKSISRKSGVKEEHVEPWYKENKITVESVEKFLKTHTPKELRDIILDKKNLE